MEWFQLGQWGWMGFQPGGWLWLDRATAALIAGALLGTNTGAWVVLDQSGMPVVPRMVEIPGIPAAAEMFKTYGFQSAA